MAVFSLCLIADFELANLGFEKDVIGFYSSFVDGFDVLEKWRSLQPF